jgi:tripartite-type tricarboxylate transporter receptor subunit TctC
VPGTTLAELLEYAKANPDKLNFGSFGIGGDSHLVFEWLKAKSGVRMTHIPYGGAAPALLAFERGEAHLLYLVATPAILERIKSGLAKPLVVPDGQVTPTLPDVRSFGQSGLPPYDSKVWFGAFAPAGTPKARVAELNRELVAAIRSPTFQDRFIKPGGYDPVGNTPDEFRAFLAVDRARGEELVKLSGVKIQQ